jgi:hypothetical protein
LDYHNSLSHVSKIPALPRFRWIGL